MSRSIVPALLAELHLFMRPVYDVAYGFDPMPDMRRLLRGCGWSITVDIDPQEIIDIVDTVITTVEDLLEDPIPDDLEEVLALIEQVADLAADIRGIGNSLADLGDVGSVTPEAAAALAEDLAHHLALRWLSSKGEFLKTAEIMGFVSMVDVDDQELGWLRRRAGTRPRVQINHIPAILRDPATYVLDRLAPTRWETAVDVQATILLLQTAIIPLFGQKAFQVPMRSNLHVPDPRDIPEILFAPMSAVSMRMDGLNSEARLALDAELFSAGDTLPGGGSGPGLALYPSGTVDTALSLAGWEAALSALINTDGQPIEISGAGVSFEPDVSASFAVSLDRQLDLVLGVGQTGLTLGRIELDTSVTASIGDPTEIRFEAVARDSSAGVSTADFGSAVANVLPLSVQVPFDLGLAWSSIHGLTLSGSASVSIAIADEISIAGGAFVFRNIQLNLGIEDEGEPAVGVGVTGDVDFALGVFEATVEGIGVTTDITFPEEGGNLGQAHLRFGMDLPERLGMSIDAEAVKGGGFITIEHEIGRYSGAVSIKIIEVGIAAITVIDTQLPGEEDGWAFFAALTLEFPAIPLGFGFTLSGLGGLIAINRGLETQAIAAGLKNGVVDALLFPDDPVNDAPMIISMIDDYFPILPGNVVVGPIVEIGWGAPKTLITAQLGVVVSLPQGRIALLGSIFALLPDPEAAVLELRLDLVGEIDIPAGTLFMQASLYDSQLLGIIELSGDMGMFLAAKGQKYFLMSVGGYHPGFQPPALVPETLHNLTRMTAAIRVADNVSVALTCYFAVTSNTVQFGSRIELEATVKVAFKTYTALGYFGFNVLLRFSPFAVIADFEAGVGVYSGDKELMGVHFEAYLEGPDPWYVTGKASFKFFGVKVKFNVEVGSQVGSEPKEIVQLRSQVVEALSDASSWTEIAPEGPLAGVTFIDEDGTDTLWIRPDHRIEVKQGIAPLNRLIEVVGQGLPAPDSERFTITDASLGTGSTSWDTAQDWFAPAQFESMTANQKLERASFEEMDAGVSFGGGGLETTGDPEALGRETVLDYEDVLYEATPEAELKFEEGYLLNAAQAGLASRQLATTEAAVTPAFAIAQPVFAVVDDIDAVPVVGTLTGGGSQYDALQVSTGGEGRVVLAATAMEAA